MPARPVDQNPVVWAAAFRIKYKDVFHLKNFYRMIHEWLLEHDWKAADGTKDHHEIFYNQKHDEAGFKEIHIWWRPEKSFTTSKFYKWKLKIDYKCLYLKSTEIMWQGKKHKVDKGEVEMKIRSYVDLIGYQQWKDHWLLKHFWNIYIKRIFYKELLKIKLLLYRETYELQDAMKRFLQLKRFLPAFEGEKFHESEAYHSHK